VCGRNLITGLTSAATPRVDISSTCKVVQKLGVYLPLLTCSPSAWPSQLLYRRGLKSEGLMNYSVCTLGTYRAINEVATKFCGLTNCDAL